MRSLSISRELASREAGLAKRYIAAYESVGYEMGFAPAAAYQGHAHLHYCDVLFSASPLACRGPDGVLDRGLLVIVPPRTYFEIDAAAPLWFLKLAIEPGLVQLPDKVPTRLSEGSPRVFAHAGHWRIPWYPSATAERRTMVLTLLGSERLQVVLAHAEAYVISR